MSFVWVLLILMLALIAAGLLRWYQDISFKRKVDTTFMKDNKSDDVIGLSKNLVLDGLKDTETIMTKDICTNESPAENTFDPILSGLDETAPALPSPEDNVEHVEHVEHIDEVSKIPEDSVEAIFARFDGLGFNAGSVFNTEVDAVFDLVFDTPEVPKGLPDIASSTRKNVCTYILDDKNVWHALDPKKKTTMVAKAIKWIIELVDDDGVINQAQLTYMYSELHAFAIKHGAHIRHSDYQNSIASLSTQMKSIKDIELPLKFYLINKRDISYSDLLSFANSFKLYNNRGMLQKIDKTLLFTMSDERQDAFRAGESYSVITITTKLHMHTDPMMALESILDFCEAFIDKFDARLLSTNKTVFGEHEYNRLVGQIRTYTENAKRKHIVLGGALISRLYG